MRTGTTGAPASIAAWKSPVRNGWMRQPSVEVPSGKPTTRPPSRRVDTALAKKDRTRSGRSRSTKRVPERRTQAPTTGHSPTSRLAT